MGIQPKGFRTRVMEVNDPEYPYYAQFTHNGLDFYLAGRYKTSKEAVTKLEEMHKIADLFIPMGKKLIWRSW